MAVPLPVAIVGGLLVFVFPGYAVTKALFPEWRVRGDQALIRMVEVASLSLVLSISITILLGYALLNLGPGGFQASWSNPQLEVGLAVVTVLGLSVSAVRGGFARNPPAAPKLEDEPDGGWETMRIMDNLGRTERKLMHALRTSAPGSREEAEARRELEAVRAQVAGLRSRREAELGR